MMFSQVTGPSRGGGPTWNLIADAQQILQYEFMQNAFMAGTIVAVLAGVVGYFVVLRRLAFACEALGHGGLAGATGAAVIGQDVFVGLLAFTSASGAIMGWLGDRLRGRDVAIGGTLAFSLALGLLFLSLSTRFSGLAVNILFGSILSIAAHNVRFIAAFAGAALLAIAVMYRPLLFASVDAEIADARGVPVRWLSVAFMVVLGITVFRVGAGRRRAAHLRVADPAGGCCAAAERAAESRPAARGRPCDRVRLGRTRRRLLSALSAELLPRSRFSPSSACARCIRLRGKAPWDLQCLVPSCCWLALRLERPARSCCAPPDRALVVPAGRWFAQPYAKACCSNASCSRWSKASAKTSRTWQLKRFRRPSARAPRPMAIPVHAAASAGGTSRRSELPGRIRWDVPGLRGTRDRAARLEQQLSDRQGILDVIVNPITARVLVTFDVERTNADAVERALELALAAPLELNGVARDRAVLARHEHEHETGFAGYALRLVAGGVTLATMLLHKLAWLPLGLPGGVATGIGLGVTIFAGYPFFRGGVRSVARLSAADTDTLITVATLASILLRESFTALVVLWLLNLGDLLQAVVLRRTRRAIRELLSVGDREAWVRLDNGSEVRVLLQDVKAGDLVAVDAGEKVPVDGPVERGQATLNEAPITGESMPVSRNVGDRVFAGTLVEAGWLHVRAEQVGDATAVGRLIQRVEEARELKAPIETIGATFSRRFVPGSFLLAGLVFLLTRDIRRSVTMLVIACPCAAGLATPTAISATIGNAARRGVLIKGGTSLESAAGIDTVVFDKTGTLTTGRPRVARVIASDSGADPEELLSLAASGELHSPHPLGLAVVRHTRERELMIPEHEECELLVGRGMRADMQGNRILVGSRLLLDEFGINVPNEIDAKVRELRTDGETVLYVSVNERFAGLIGVADLVRPEAQAALDALELAGVGRTIMLTGDAHETAEPVARRLGVVEFHADVMPEAKLDLVRRLQADRHRVAMVGDGINDAPSLAAADLGIAIGTGGADLAIEAADVALASSDIREVANVIEQSRHTLRVVRQNYGLALGVNGAGILVGALGALNPVVAAVLHNLSTLAVVANSSRLIGYKSPFESR